MTLANIKYLESKLVQHVLNSPDDKGHWLGVLADVIEIRVTIANMAIPGDVTGKISQEDYTNLVLWFEQLKQQWPEHDNDAPDGVSFYEDRPINEVVFDASVTYTVKKTYEIHMPEGTTREYVDDNLETLIADDTKSNEAFYWESAETIELEDEEEE